MTLTCFFLIFDIYFSRTDILFSSSSMSFLLTDAADVTVMNSFIVRLFWSSFSILAMLAATTSLLIAVGLL